MAVKVSGHGDAGEPQAQNSCIDSADCIKLAPAGMNHFQENSLRVMRSIKLSRIFTTLCCGLLMLFAGPAFSIDATDTGPIMVAAADAESSETGKPESGTLVLPAATEKKEADKKH